MTRFAAPVAALVLASEVPTNGDVWAEAAKYGLIGLLLVTFVYWSRTDKEKADKALAALDGKLIGLIERQTRAHEESKASLDKLTDELRSRPCMMEKKEEREGRVPNLQPR